MQEVNKVETMGQENTFVTCGCRSIVYLYVPQALVAIPRLFPILSGCLDASPRCTVSRPSRHSCSFPLMLH